ncbi:MAG: nucleic acid/nucleotide deaminase domain-containing protein [Moheibacter sp.]
MKLKKVAYGESELSKSAIIFRKSLGNAKRHNGNIAIVEYIDDVGKSVRKEFTTLTEPEWKALGYDDKPHAERIMADWILDNNIPKEKVTKIYSELEPCNFEDHKCKKLLETLFPNAEKEFSYDYPGILGDNLKSVRDASIKERANDMNKLVK